MNEHGHDKSNRNYFNLVIMGVLSFISMYILMYAMVDRFDHVVMNMNQF